MSYFCFYCHYSRSGSEKTLLWFRLESVQPIFSSKSFIESGLIFNTLIHFEFIIVYGSRKCFNFTLLHVAVQFSPYHLLKGLSFSSIYCCLLCHRLVDYSCVGLILGFLSCSTDLYFYLCASTIQF